MISGLSERLREKRIGRNLNQRQVAELAGISASLVSNYEQGTRVPSLEVLVALARVYRCSTDYLLGLDKKDNSFDTSMLNSNQRAALQNFLTELSNK